MKSLTDVDPPGHETVVLVARTNDGDLPASPPADFQSVYQAHHAFVWRILRRMGVPWSALEDATQDVFIVVHRRWTERDPARNVRSWLFGIARRVAADVRRGEWRRNRKLRALPAPDPAPGPEAAMVRARAAEFVDQFLKGLDSPKAMVFVLMDIEGLTAPEVADALEIPLNTVYSRLRAARKRFERALQRTARQREPHV